MSFSTKLGTALILLLAVGFVGGRWYIQYRNGVGIFQSLKEIGWRWPVAITFLAIVISVLAAAFLSGRRSQ